MLPNASEIEWVWTIACLVALLSCLYTGYRRTRRGIAAIRLNPDEATVWLFIQRASLSIMFVIMLSVFTLVGVRAMSLPPPVRTDTQRDSVVLAIAFVVVALIIALFNVMLVLTDPVIDRALDGQEETRARRDVTRDAGRDEGRDPIRDAARDIARDLETEEQV